MSHDAASRNALNALREEARCPAAPLVLRRAVQWHERASGLLVGPRLRAGHGLWIMRCRAIHTVGMRYTIAVFFLDEFDRVTSAICSVKPCSWAHDKSAASVIETLEIRPGHLCHAILRVERSARCARGQLAATCRRAARRSAGW